MTCPACGRASADPAAAATPAVLPVLVLVATLVATLAVAMFGGGCSREPTEGEAESMATQADNGPAGTLTSAIPVRVAAVGYAELAEQATASGVVEAFRKTTVAAEVSGRVISRGVEPGDRVTAGQPLLVLDSERTRIARDEALAQMQAREVDLREARSERRRGEDLYARDFISEDALETLRFAESRAAAQLTAARAALAAADRALADSTIRAPYDGTAERIHVQAGDYLTPGTPVATVADFSRVRIRAGVTARETALLMGSKRAELELEAMGSERYVGAVQSVGRIADPATGTYLVEIWLDNPGDRVREGLLATVYLPYQSGARQLTVPASAAFRRGGGMHVFVINDGRAELRPVRIGRTGQKSVEVLDGLTEGEQVVTSGQFALRDGAAVAVEARAAAEP